MARKIIFLSFWLLQSLVAFGDSSKVCSQQWMPLPVTENSIYHGRIFESKFIPNSGLEVIVKDFDNKVINRFTLPKEATSFTPVGNKGTDFIYKTPAEQLVHYSASNKTETVLPRNKADWPCHDESSPLLTSCNGEEPRYFYDIDSAKKVVVPNAKEIKYEGHTVAALTSLPNSNGSVTLTLHDLKLGKNENFQLPAGSQIQNTAENHVSVKPPNQNEAIHFVKTSSGWLRFDDTQEKQLAGVLSSGEILFTESHHKSGSAVAISEYNFNEFQITTTVYDSLGQKVLKTLPGYYMTSVYYGPAVFKLEIPMKVSTYSEAAFKSLDQNTNQSPQIISNAYGGVSKDGQWGTKVDNNNYARELVNLNTGQHIPLTPYKTGQIEVGKSGRYIRLRGTANQNYVVDTITGKMRAIENSPFGISFDDDFKHYFIPRYGRYEKKIEFCFPLTVKIVPCDCEIKDPTTNPLIDEKAFSTFRSITLKALCNGPFNPTEWDKYTPAIPKGEITEKQAMLYLMRFQKSGGFDPEKHLAILSGILNSDFPKTNPTAVYETLKSIAVGNSSLVRAAYLQFDLDHKLPSRYEHDATQTCVNSYDQQLRESFLKMAIVYAENPYFRSTTEDWTAFKPFKEEFQKMPAEQREAVVHNIADRLSEDALVSTDLAGTFQSALFYFSKKFALDLVGDRSKPSSFVAVAVRDSHYIPIILSSNELANPTKPTSDDVLVTNPYGFYYQVKPPLDIPQTAQKGDSFKQELSWKAKGQNFTATIDANVQEPLAQLVSHDKSPDYPALKPSGTLTGMMIIGSNMSSGSQSVVDSYLTYYQNAGFEFKDPVSINSYDFFKNKVRTGELSYLIKEAHSDGDENNLFRARPSGKLYVGTLTKSNGAKETMYLVTPDDTKTPDKLISNQEFGQWLRQRGVNRPMVYLNASCSSTRKVISEIAAAHTSNLIPIASTTSVLPFSNDESNGTYRFLESFRNGQDYDSIRRNISKSQNYVSGRDHFIFPDEKEYQELILNNLKLNLDVQVTVKNAAGNQVFIDETVDH